MAAEIPPETGRALIDYLRELARWNRAYNLSAVRGPSEMVVRHLLDSLSVLPHLHGNRVVDVGSGAGLPGLVLALCCPDKTVTLLESNGKRIAFLRHIKRRLVLGNVRVVHARAERYRDECGGFDIVMTRAFAPLNKMLAQCAHLCAAQGTVLAMKGHEPVEELKGVPVGFIVHEIHRLNVPGLTAARHLVILCPRAGNGH